MTLPPIDRKAASVKLADTSADLARLARILDPSMGSGASIVASHGYVDDGYAEGDDTSRWIERIESSFA